MEKGLIQPRTSQYNPPLFFVKKTKGTLYICINYRALDAKIIIDAYPIPCIDNILNCLGGSVTFSKIEFAQGKYQVRMAKGHEHRSVFLDALQTFWVLSSSIWAI